MYLKFSPIKFKIIIRICVGIYLNLKDAFRKNRKFSNLYYLSNCNKITNFLSDKIFNLLKFFIIKRTLSDELKFISVT